jgi:ATP-dependent Clp protease ATP-binding subunit ClpC
LPDKAIDCLDEACSTATSRINDAKDGKVTITKDDIVLAVACQTDMPVEVVGVSDANRARSLNKYLKDRIIGQDAAINSVSSLLMGAFSGIRDMSRPIGCFVFGGPSGSGTTFMAEKMAEGLFESHVSLVRINMSEFSEKFGSTKLMGSPPGYIGYGDSNQLTDKVMRRPYCLILLRQT